MSDTSTRVAPVALTPDFIIPATGCADLAFARALAESMRDGSGRQNSRAFDRGGGGLSIISRSSPWVGLITDADSAWAASQRIGGPIPPARAIGRLGGHAIRERPQDCGVGDAVPGSYFEDGNSDFIYTFPPDMGNTVRPGHSLSRGEEFQRIASETTWTFERVRLRVTTDDGIWHDEHLWKRIE